MSSETSQFDPEETVLRYRASGPAILLPIKPSHEELAFDWTLSEKDKALVLENRGVDNVCRFAVQLCVFRKHGRFLSDYSQVCPSILGYLCQQLDTEPVIFLDGSSRRNTESDYHARITSHLDWKVFDERASKVLYQWILDQVSEQLYVENLVAKSEAFLRQSKIMIPGPTVMEKEVNSACRMAEKLVWAKLAAQIPVQIRSAIDRLMTVSNASKSDFYRFAEYPPEARAKKIVEYLTRYEELAALKLETIRFDHVSPQLIRKLASVVRTYDVWQLKRFEPNKRYSLALSFLWDAKQSMLDYLVEMHAHFMTDMKRKSERDWEEEHRRLRRRLKVGIESLKNLASEVLSLKESEEPSLSQLLERVDTERIKTAMADCEAFEELEKFGYLKKLHSRYANFRRYFPYFANLDFQADAGGQAIVDALSVLRCLESGELKSLPKDVDTSFVREAWRNGIPKDGSEGIDRRTWEISLAFALREALNSARVYLPESRQYVSFWDLCYNDSKWQQERDEAYVKLSLPTEGKEATRKLAKEFHEAATAAEVGLASNPFIKLVGSRLVVSKDPPVPEPDGTEEFRQLVDRHLPKIRIERLIEEVDERCAFTRHLKPPGRDVPDTPERRQLLHATLTAHATNLGIFGMVGSTQGMTVDQLQRISRSCLYRESLHQGNVELVNHLRTLKHSRFFGDGTRSSSDGQRFGVEGSSLLATCYPRYFGYYDQVVTVYTHMFDQFGVFKTQVISCAEREALYVLAGLLAHDTELDIQEHFTDTHGFTEQLFGLCYLLGFSFMPRIKNFKSQDLYHPGDGQKHDPIQSLFCGKVDLDLIAEQWDSLVRIAASLKNRVVSAHVLAKRLINLGTTHPLAKALTQLGQLVKTTYLLRYMTDAELRRIVQLMLNRGEARQNLAKHVFYFNQGRFRSGDYFNMMNQANCLSLLSNAIIAWNTQRFGDILDLAESNGKSFSDDALAHVQPLQFKHVIVNGTYEFRIAA